GGGGLAPASALGLAVLAPFVVRLPVGREALLSALVRLLEAVGIDLREVLLGRALQELEAIALLPAQAFAAAALHESRRVRPPLPGEEHRPLLVGQQADEGELGARRILVDHCAVAGEDRADRLVADLAAVALEAQAGIALEHHGVRAGAAALEVLE